MDNEYVMRGNAAILKCSIPSFVADFVHVVAWVDEEGTEIIASDDYDGSKPAKLSSCNLQPNSFLSFNIYLSVILNYLAGRLIEQFVIKYNSISLYFIIKLLTSSMIRKS